MSVKFHRQHRTHFEAAARKSFFLLVVEHSLGTKWTTAEISCRHGSPSCFSHAFITAWTSRHTIVVYPVVNAALCGRWVSIHGVCVDGTICVVKDYYVIVLYASLVPCMPDVVVHATYFSQLTLSFIFQTVSEQFM